MKNYLRAPHIVLSLAVLTSLAPFAHAQDRRERLLERVEAKKQSFEKSASKMLADLDPKINANVDFSIFGGIEPGLKYTYDVEPAYQGDLYMRLDRWRPRVRLELPGILTRIEAGSEIVFIRNFPSKGDAVKSKPEFDLKKLPLSAENALNLKTGEAVMLPLDLNLMFGAEATAPLSPIAVYGRGYYVMRGRYQIQVLRLAEQRVRLRLVAIRSSGVEAEAGLKLNLDIFELNVLNNAVEGILGRRLGTLGFGRGPQAVVMADYMFNLADPATRSAFDRLLAADQRLNHVKMVSPVTRRDDMQEMMISDLTEVDKLAREDAKKPSEQKRVVQFFKGQSSGTVERPFLQNYSVNLLRLLTFQKVTTVSTDNHIMFLDSDNEESNFMAPQAVKESRTKLLFGLRSESFSRKASVVVPADSKGQPEGLGEYVVSVEVKDKRMGLSETSDILKYFKRSVAPVAISELALDSLLEEARYKNARVFVQIIFNEASLAQLQGTSSQTLEQKLKAYLASNAQNLPGDNEAKHLDWIDDHKGEAKRMIEALNFSLNSAQPAKERIRTFIELQKNDFFRDIGSGFLMSMLPAAELRNLVSVSVRADAQGFAKPVEKEFGSSEFRGVIKATEYIQHMLNLGTFDLRLETFGTAPAAVGQIFPAKAVKALVTPPVAPVK